MTPERLAEIQAGVLRTNATSLHAELVDAVAEQQDEIRTLIAAVHDLKAENTTYAMGKADGLREHEAELDALRRMRANVESHFGKIANLETFDLMEMPANGVFD